MKLLSQKNLVSLLYFLLPVIVVFSGQNLVGARYTAWDTHDFGFTNFLYFSDSIFQGIIPLWNPFIQSGTFFPSLNNAGLFSPLVFPFALIAHFLSPVVVYEWLIQFIILLGGIGTYLFCRSAKLEHDLACLGATIYLITTLIPNMGQFGFIFTLSLLPWMLAAAHAITERKLSLAAWPLFGVLCGFAMASGYPWMNLVNCGIFVGYTAFLHCSDRSNSREVAFRFIYFLLPALLTYSLFIFPGYSDLIFNYSNFAGDYIYPAEEVQRGINSSTLKSHHYDSLWTAIKVLINPDLFGVTFAGWRSETTTGWSMGVGFITALLLVNAALKKPEIKLVYYFWIALAAAGLFYASANQPMAYLSKHLPLFSSNRWWFLGLDYSVIALLVLALLWTQDAFSKAALTLPGGLGLTVIKYGVLLVLILFLLGQRIPAGPVLIILSAIAVLTFQELTRNRRGQIIFLTVLAVAEALLLVRTWANDNTYGSSFLMNKRYSEQVKQRNSSPIIINQNERITTSTDWHISKTPSSGGNNNLGNPLYWYIQGTPIVSQLFTLANNSRQEKTIRRADYKNDNTYVDAIIGDILSNPQIPTADIPLTINSELGTSTPSRILHTELQPNKGIVSVEIAEPTLVIFNSNYAPGWEAYVNGKPVPLIKINHLFMGVEIKESGHQNVTFEYKPTMVIVTIFLPYIALLIFSLLFFWLADLPPKNRLPRVT